jgi:hypothetical protein
MKVFLEEPLEIASKVVKIKDFPGLSAQNQGFLKVWGHKKTPIFFKWESLFFKAELNAGFLSLINQYLPAVIQFTLMPVSPVVQVHLTRSRVFGQCRGSSLVMGTTFIPSGLGGFSLRMCHDALLFFVR